MSTYLPKERAIERDRHICHSCGILLSVDPLSPGTDFFCIWCVDHAVERDYEHFMTHRECSQFCPERGPAFIERDYLMGVAA